MRDRCLCYTLHMPKNPVHSSKLVIIGQSSYLIKPLESKDLVGNKMMIEKINEERQIALLAVQDFDIKINELREENWELKLENQKLGLELRAEKQKYQIELKAAERKSSLVFILSLVATIFVGIGINLVTSSFYTWIGWVMIVAACIIEILAFLIKPEKSKK